MSTTQQAEEFAGVTASIEEVIEDARNGRMFILVDDEDRENEGDIVIPAQMATPDAINFMAKHARGLICLALTPQRVEELKLPLMPQHNASRLQTAFTVSIEAREGVTTGISAPDRARTIAVAIDPTKGGQDLVTPGHVFPLAAREGGVLVRSGHTEAAVDISRLAGLNPSGVICEIMSDDGTMARRPELIAFAQRHGLKIATIADLINYRRRTEKLVRRQLETEIDSMHGGRFRLVTYVNTINGAEHLVLVKGDVADGKPVLTRIHSQRILDDVLGCGLAGRGRVLQAAMEEIGREGRGLIVMIRQFTNTALSDEIRARLGEMPGLGDELRDYGTGAQMVHDQGVREMVLLSNSKRSIVGLEGHGLKVVGYRPIPIAGRG
ncbi:MAG TPA: 3,4-dihydroxy-2-butanone-4-phosphate synthase [Stellaceae bacterium]|nr:3,4-dihydroxy-2-butanone-4-phosphate synthase [Stellaceae bacterium]